MRIGLLTLLIVLVAVAAAGATIAFRPLSGSEASVGRWARCGAKERTIARAGMFGGRNCHDGRLVCRCAAASR